MNSAKRLPTSGVLDTDGKWKKSSRRKVLIVLFGHLWVVELKYRFAKGIVDLGGKFATGINDNSGSSGKI
jgi:hypothetical protein